MDKAISKLLELREALEKATKIPSVKVPELPSPKAPKMPSAPKLDMAAPTMPKQPDLTPGSKKDPSKQAQQIKDPETKDQAMSEAKAKLKLAKNGQWSLDEEPMDKGIKTAIAGAVLAGSTLLPMKAAAAPIKAAVTPTAQTHDVLDHGNGEKSTLNTRSYGPYKVTTMLQPSSSPGKSSTELTHQVQFVGEAHSPEHAKALAAELKGSGIDHKQIMGLQAGDDLMSNKGKNYTGPASKDAPSLWNKTTISKSGQWSLEKGAMKRLAPKPSPSMAMDLGDFQEPGEDQSASLRGQRALVTRHSDNPHAFKMINGVKHIMLHRGIGDYNPEQGMRQNSNSLSHDSHGVYTDSHRYAGLFGAGRQDHNGKKLDGTTHSVWVPISKIDRNSHYEGNSNWANSKNNPKSHFNSPDDGDLKQYGDIENWKTSYEDAYGTGGSSGYGFTARGNHLLVKPGTYTHATPEEVAKYNTTNLANTKKTGIDPSSFEAYETKSTKPK